MNILVTGGAGYIGSHTCVALLEQGHSVVVVDNLCNSSPEALKRVQQLTGKSLGFYQGDVRDEALLRQIFRENEIHCVIHFAGLKAVPESVAHPRDYYDNNVGSTLILTKIMEEAGVRRIVFSSSATVYAVSKTMPLQETCQTGSCSNPYGWSKYMSEQILSDIANSDPRWSVCLLRYFNPAGAHPSGKLGEDPQGIPNNLMPYITQVAVGRREHLNVYGNDYNTPDGTGVRDYIHVCDLAEGHVAAVGYAAEHTGCQVFNLGTGVGYSVLDIVHAFRKANNVPLPYVIGPRRPGDIDLYYADPGKSACVLGWKARRSLEDMCRDAWNWQKNNPNGYR